MEAPPEDAAIGVQEGPFTVPQVQSPPSPMTKEGAGQLVLGDSKTESSVVCVSLPAPSRTTVGLTQHYVLSDRLLPAHQSRLDATGRHNNG